MKKYKFLKASGYYFEVINQIYHSNPNLKEESYENQYKKIIEKKFANSDFWKLNFESFGDYEFHEIITNAEFLQKKWASENNITYNQDSWLIEILEAQIKKIQPDIFFPQDYWNIKTSHIKKIKNEVGNIKLTLGWDGIAYKDLNFYGECDIILSCLKEVADFYTKNSKVGYFLKPGFESSILENISTEKKNIDLSFVGSLIPGKNMHNKRYDLLSKVSNKTPLEIWSPNLFEKNNFKKYGLRKKIWKNNFKELKKLYGLNKRWRGSAFGIDMYNIISCSKITLNSHIDVAKNSAANMRLWEATGVGTCLLTDWKENLSEIFIEDEEIVTYKTHQECIDKVNYLLNNESLRNKIAKAGKNRVLKDYTLNKILKEFDIFIKTNWI